MYVTALGLKVLPQLTLAKLSVPSIYKVVLELKHSTASFSTQNTTISKETCKFKGKYRIRCKSLSEGSFLFSSEWNFFLRYRIFASTSPSCIEAHAGLFRSLMKGIFDPYVLWPFVKQKLVNPQILIVKHNIM